MSIIWYAFSNKEWFELGGKWRIISSSHVSVHVTEKSSNNHTVFNLELVGTNYPPKHCRAKENYQLSHHPSKLIKIYKCFFFKQIYDPLYYRYILFAVFPVLSIHLAFWQNQNSGIMGFQGFAYTSGKIFQLSFCSERFLFLERWNIWKNRKLLIMFSRMISFYF